VNPLLAGLWLALTPADAGVALERLGGQKDLNYVVIDARTREVVAARWPDIQAAIPAGSLVKLFTALAYPEAYPELECKGASGGCWRLKPHGRLHFTEALAQSCNAYFLQLAAGVNGETLAVTAAAFGIPAPASQTAVARIGVGDAWRISPLALVRAYAELALRRGDPRADAILAGLERAAQSGTAQEIGKSVPRLRILAKTGTAPCTAERRHAGDGFAVAVYPAVAPRVAMLVRVHNVPGAEAAKAAARLVRTIERR
jgi:cell division protein FtsI/penicillin-binding protein 2